jgi:hypothetical protein
MSVSTMQISFLMSILKTEISRFLHFEAQMFDVSHHIEQDFCDLRLEFVMSLMSGTVL